MSSITSRDLAEKAWHQLPGLQAITGTKITSVAKLSSPGILFGRNFSLWKLNWPKSFFERADEWKMFEWRVRNLLVDDIPFESRKKSQFVENFAFLFCRRTDYTGNTCWINQVSRDAPTLPWGRFRFRLGVELGLGLALREVCVDTSPETWIGPTCCTAPTVSAYTQKSPSTLSRFVQASWCFSSPSHRMRRRCAGTSGKSSRSCCFFPGNWGERAEQGSEDAHVGSVHSLTHPSNHPPTHPPTQVTHPPTNSTELNSIQINSTYSPAHSPTHPPTQPPTHSSTHARTRPLIHQQTLKLIRLSTLLPTHPTNQVVIFR